MRNRIFLGALFLAFLSCSVPEDKLWPKRLADVSNLRSDSLVVAALDLDVAPSMDSLNQDSLRKIALRDLAIYAFGQNKILDTARFMQDSILPKFTMEHAQTRLQQALAQAPYLQRSAAWSTDQWRTRQINMLQAMQKQAQSLMLGPSSLDSILHMAIPLNDSSIARIPVGAFLVKNHRHYWWVILVQSGDKPGTVAIDSTDHPDPHFKHLQGLSFDAQTRQPVGSFFSE